MVLICILYCWYIVVLLLWYIPFFLLMPEYFVLIDTVKGFLEVHECCIQWFVHMFCSRSHVTEEEYSLPGSSFLQNRRVGYPMYNFQLSLLSFDSLFTYFWSMRHYTQCWVYLLFLNPHCVRYVDDHTYLNDLWFFLLTLFNTGCFSYEALFFSRTFTAFWASVFLLQLAVILHSNFFQGPQFLVGFFVMLCPSITVVFTFNHYNTIFFPGDIILLISYNLSCHQQEIVF
jgi:hypothetical protein